ncbi:flagellar assembly protein FliX [Methylobacterium gnaphalii]|uniref:Flagellar assembly protein FliX n=1 Tax=Methylobacterium gnaphalii TaxID=1010610 RepID=A0A512JKA9_9HYPH|nr:flagellar assembly protein FliX [Methylobacterium gnaphalii]GEP10396.1 flagellar assembly protein FliX [Methylobacterium gnaphalii]GJD69185.1 Flagellar assembly protein FliX [Methylobacterium gnaphalii]GLS47734.1 flagellar assembly protein FliX [Methylobacterium gnaphalii]
MRVEQRFAATAAGPATAGRRADAARAFSLTDNAQQARSGTSATTQTGMLAGLDAILTLQGNEDTPHERRRRSVKRGHDLLDGLDRLKAAILGGRVATHELQAIARRLSDRAESSGDPRLDGLVAEIELRAAVELAKLEALRGT